jgi:hypothetical protein
MLDEAALSAWLIADQLGHARPSRTQDVYLARRDVGDAAAQALDAALRPDAPESRLSWVDAPLAEMASELRKRPFRRVPRCQS